MKYFIDADGDVFAFEDSDSPSFVAKYAQPDWTQIPELPIVASPPLGVPQQVSMRQACLELEDAGLLDDVEALVATLPRPYQIEWQRASMVQRNNPLVEVVRVQQGMTPEDVDALFVRADAR